MQTTKNHRCPFCDISFTYNENDVKRKSPVAGSIQCPVCKRQIVIK